jgi:hypothetical protein
MTLKSIRGIRAGDEAGAFQRLARAFHESVSKAAKTAPVQGRVL